MSTKKITKSSLIYIIGRTKKENRFSLNVPTYLDANDYLTIEKAKEFIKKTLNYDSQDTFVQDYAHLSLFDLNQKWVGFTDALRKERYIVGVWRNKLCLFIAGPYNTFYKAAYMHNCSLLEKVEESSYFNPDEKE